MAVRPPAVALARVIPNGVVMTCGHAVSRRLAVHQRLWWVLPDTIHACGECQFGEVAL